MINDSLHFFIERRRKYLEHTVIFTQENAGVNLPYPVEEKGQNRIKVIPYQDAQICTHSVYQYDSAIGYCRLRACEGTLIVLQFSIEIRLSFRILYG